MGPLILTLELNEDLAFELDRWRERYFPRERNYLSAHVTLFHALPPEKYSDIATAVRELCARTARYPVLVKTAYSLGRGVALEVEAETTSTLRSVLRERWLPDLSPQDRATKTRPHVTIQNKVSVEESRRTLTEVRALWPSDTRGHATGLRLWEYRGGPWGHLESFPFTSDASSSS